MQAGVQMAGPQSQNQQPQAAPAINNSNVSEDGVSIRPMRLKVLYTFDDECKTNCLARWPHVLQIQTVAMDDTNSIGVIELYTCLQAVIECSPELMPRLGRDFTVYAYDFSEYDNPLVGQGMLSKALATPPPTPNPTNGQSQKLVTGRVCKNILGIFANGVKETLEVKLRLTPVQTIIPNEYAKAAGNVSHGVSPSFDQNEWNAFMQSHQTAPQVSNRTATPVLAPNNKRDGTSMEVMNQLLSPSLQPVQPVQQAQQVQQVQPAPPVQPIRPAQPSMNSYNQQIFAPAPTVGPSAPTQHAEKEPIPRPSSRTIVAKKRRGRPPKKAATVGGHTSGYEDGTDGDDGPMPKKRAKIMQADWNSKSSFGTGSDSLRVTASTAGSIRSFRPLSMSGTQGPGNHLKEIPRAPTPVPILPQLSVQRPQSQSGLRQDSIPQMSPPEDHLSPYPQLEPSLPPEDQLRLSIESANPSPERMMSPALTPQDIASSPPVLRTATPMGSSPPCPSSPSLPPMPRFDSGFMSGSIDDLFGEEDETLRPIDEEDIEVAKKYTKRRQRKPQPVAPAPGGLHIEEETPGPMELLPTRMPIFEPHKQKILPALSVKSRRGSIVSEDGQTLPPLRHDTHASSSRPPPNQTAPMTHPPPSLHLPTPPTSEHPRPPMQPMHVPTVPQPRAASKPMTRTASTGCLPTSNVPASDPIPPRTFNRSQTWSEMPHHMSEAPDTVTQLRQTDIKKAAIRQKLEAAIANGKMPPYCENCGAIETPTWRKAWSQEHQGAPGYHDYSEEPGRVTSITILARDTEGTPTSYLLIKKALAPDEDVKQFKEFNLCNPCGIWMSKYKSQRPEERWARGNQDGDSKKKPRSRPSKSKKTAGVPTSEANFPQSEGPTGLDRLSPIDLDPVEPVEQTESKDDTSTQPAENRRSTSVRPTKRLNAMTSDAASAALKRALQSSPARWTKNNSADVTEERDTTRRLLFPSPRKDGSSKVLGEVATNVVQVVVDFHSTKDGAAEALDKENSFPIFSAEDDAELMRLFEEELARPTTPDQKTPVANPFKTPTRATPNHRPITRSVSRSNRSVRSPNRHLMPPKTPSRTPGSASRRRSPRGNAVFESPFTAQLNQLMSDAGVRIDSPSRHLDFSNLPDLPNLDGGSYNLQQYDEDFFSTDVPMPSSPPRMFHSFNNSAGGNIDWDNFGLDTNSKENEKEKSGDVKKEPSEEEGINEAA
ncbi:gata transcription factor protein [Rutstroemia sp. NJR-2017a BVV2]|nr:gata transcription factor protein [Rutstroemia sp. NJR-2017a BVV2]